MPKFLIEVWHEATASDCIRAADTFIRSGSHFLTRAEWGCMDGDHRAWLIVEVDGKEEAKGIVPPSLRAQAKVVQLHAFTLEMVEELRRRHSS